MEKFIEQIKIKRKEKGLSQADLAKQVGVPQSTIGRFESGRTMPNLKTLQKIADCLNVEIMLTGKDTGSPYLKRWNDLRFTCYWKDEPVSDVCVRGNVVLIKRYIEHPVKQLFYSDKMDLFQLTEILRTRCWQEERADIDQILKKLGIEYYDPLEIVKRTHGISYNDFLWIQFGGEFLHWKDVAPRRFRYGEN